MSLTVRGAVYPSAGLRTSQASFERGLSRISSGLRVQRAADDAAGLAISERLRAQVGGTAVATRNVHDGINMLRTAEGGLTTITDVLQRLRDLSVQASSATTTSGSRAAIATETAQLVEEIERTAQATSFNGQRLLDGSRPGGFAFQVGASTGDQLAVRGADVRADTLGLRGTAAAPAVLVTSTSSVAETHHAAVSSSFISFTTSNSGNRKLTITLDAVKLVDIPLASATTYTASSLADLVRASLPAPPAVTIDVVAGDAPGQSRLRVRATADGGGPTTLVGVTIGGNAAGRPTFSDEQTSVAVPVTSTAWAAGAPAVDGLVDMINAGSADAIGVCDAALNVVVGARAELGAVQNRMEHCLGVLAATELNLTTARSRIVDADVAREWADVVRAQVLTQAGLAMQAQSGQRGQRVLQLLTAR